MQQCVVLKSIFKTSPHCKKKKNVDFAAEKKNSQPGFQYKSVYFTDIISRNYGQNLLKEWKVCNIYRLFP